MFNFLSKKVIRENRKQRIEAVFQAIRTQLDQPQHMICAGLAPYTLSTLKTKLAQYKHYLLEENANLDVSCDHCIRVSDALQKLTSSTSYQDFQQNMALFNTANEDLRYNLKARQLGRTIVAILLPVVIFGFFSGLAIMLPPAALALGVMGCAFGVIGAGAGSAYASIGTIISNNVTKTKETGLVLHGIFSRVSEIPPPAYAQGNYQPVEAPAYQLGDSAPPAYDRGTYQVPTTNHSVDVSEDGTSCPAYS